MWLSIIVISFLFNLCNANEVCDNTKCAKSENKTCEHLQWSDFEYCKIVNLNNNSISTIIPTENYKSLKILDLSHNRLTELPENFLSNANALEIINLGNNKLHQLPKNFLNNSDKVKVIQLEGNQLTEIPPSVFHSSLRNLSVDCTCSVIGNIREHLKDNSTDHLHLSVTCTTLSFTSNFEKADHFFAENCGSQNLLVLYIVLPILVLGLIIGGVALYIWKKKNNSTNFGNKTVTETSSSHGQPRYMTRNTDAMASSPNQGPKQDYENVFVGHFQTNKTKPHVYSKEQSRQATPSKQPVEEDIYLESDINDGSQPIYSNTQGVYYNYCDQGGVGVNKEDDDVYILPDH